MAKIYPLRRASSLALPQRKTALLRQSGLPPDLLRASFVERFTTCGKTNCAYARGQKRAVILSDRQPRCESDPQKSLLKTSVRKQAVQHGVAGYQAHCQRLEDVIPDQPRAVAARRTLRRQAMNRSGQFWQCQIGVVAQPLDVGYCDQEQIQRPSNMAVGTSFTSV